MNAKRLAEIENRMSEIRATWTNEQKNDWTFDGGAEFKALCDESFRLLAINGRIIIPSETVVRYAEAN